MAHPSTRLPAASLAFQLLHLLFMHDAVGEQQSDPDMHSAMNGEQHWLPPSATSLLQQSEPGGVIPDG
jgi:hypothetical protein